MKINAKKILVALASAGLMAAASSAGATTLLSGWNLNLADGSSATNVNSNGIVIGGNSTVVLGLNNGNPVGQTFTDTGTLYLSTYANPSSPSNVVDGAQAYLSFVLTGTFNADGSLTFNTGGTVSLIDGHGNTDATFTLAKGTGSGFNSSTGGAGVDSTVDVTLLETSGAANLFTYNGVDLSAPWTVQFVNVNATDNNGGVPVSTTPTSETLAISNGGHLTVANVPEPSSVGLAGIGLLALLAIARRKA